MVKGSSKEMDGEGIEHVKMWKWEPLEEQYELLSLPQASEKTSSAKPKILSTKAGRVDEAASTEELTWEDSWSALTRASGRRGMG